MEAVATDAARWRRLSDVADLRAVNTWVLCGCLVLYLGFSGGGYAFSTYGQVGIVVWWLVVIACAWGLLPRTALSRAALVTLTALGAFTAWTALGITWSISAGRSFQDLALVTTYFGILVLGVAVHRERSSAMRHTANAVATGIVVIAAVSLATRLWPGFIPSARTLDDANSRLAWPLDYWNALASLTVLGIPLLLSIATSARRLGVQALAAGAIPIVVLCGALTQSRGGLIAAGVALVVWLACVPERVPKLSTGAFSAAGSAALVAGGFHDRAIRLAQTGALEHHQAGKLLTAIVFVCAGVAVAQLGIGRALRHATPPQTISPPRRTAAALLGASLVVLIVAGLVIGVPHKLDHLWHDFKNPINQSTAATHLAATSGEGRYQYWVAGVDSAKSHVLIGSGPGTFQQDWLPRAHIYSYVTNAHSLYVETYTELGLVGLVLLGGFILSVLATCGWVVLHSTVHDRTRAAGITAAVVAFFVGAAFDWLWQVPVLVAIVLLLSASLLAPGLAPEPGAGEPPGRTRRVTPRRLAGVSATLIGLVALAAVAYPLSVNTDIANSQSAVNVGDPAVALRDARAAVKLESGSAEAQIQLALVLERQHAFGAALAAALHATAVESQNWTNWLTLSRIEAENGHATASVRAYRKARSLNPESSLFQS
jgi:O-antigen ligase